MNQQLRCMKTAAALCAELGEEDGIAPRFLISKDAGKKSSRKALQLCKEAMRIVSLVLNGETRQPLLADLQVVSVRPEPDGLSLRVCVGHFASDFQVTEFEVLAALKPIQGLLRCALARALHRKHAPILSFQYLGVLGKGDSECQFKK